MPEEQSKHRPHLIIIRAIIEIASILFLFYANLLMGQYTAGQNSKPLSFAVSQIFTAKSFAIGIVSALIGYGVFEYLRSRA